MRVEGYGIPAGIECFRETNALWIAEMQGMPGALAYGKSLADAVTNVRALAQRVIADRAEHGE